MTVTTTEDKSLAADGDRAEDPIETGAATLVEEDLLVEDVSIDGMCGVY